MSVALDKVPKWTVFAGVGCAVGSTDSWTHTICGSHILGVHVQSERPKRICSKCRKKLSEPETKTLQ